MLKSKWIKGLYTAEELFQSGVAPRAIWKRFKAKLFISKEFKQGVRDYLETQTCYKPEKD